MKIIKVIAIWTIVFWAVVGTVSLGVWWLAGPQALTEGSESRQRLELTPFNVDTVKITVIDSERSTPALGEFDGDDKRVLSGKVWYPAGESTGHPLLVYSHGFGGEHKESSHLAEYLASKGYIVAAINFPLSHMRSPAGVPQLLDVANQAGDVRALINYMVAENADKESQFFRRIDDDAIGAMGLSLGGLTTALASFHPEYKDERIDAAVMLAPPLEAFSELFYASNKAVHSLIISGSYDRIVPEIANAVEILPRHPKGWFISLEKGTHLGFADVANPLRWMDNPDDLGCFIMDWMLAKQELPERWDAVISNTNGELRDIVASQPCPELSGEAMNGLRQQWLTRIAVGAFFDMHLKSGQIAQSASEFFASKLDVENADLRLTSPRRTSAGTL